MRASRLSLTRWFLLCQVELGMARFYMLLAFNLSLCVVAVLVLASCGGPAPQATLDTAPPEPSTAAATVSLPSAPPPTPSSGSPRPAHLAPTSRPRAIPSATATVPRRTRPPTPTTRAQTPDWAPPRPTSTRTPALAPGWTRARVLSVTDGDSIVVEVDGEVREVRYIGIDCPEGTEALGPEATRENAELVGGKMVELERDVSETDRYGRLLRYVWVGDLLVNGELVRLGYATARAYPPDVRHQDLLARLEKEAREAGRGLWALVGQPTASRSGGNCDPAYPTVCIPPPPPDLDCADIPYRRFQVLPPDPHHFDGDHNGVGCERD